MNTEAFAVKIGKVRLEHPIMNGAGYCKDWKHVKELCSSASAALVLGSITKEFRSGNSDDILYQRPGYTLNSLGLPNRGVEYYMSELRAMTTYAKDEPEEPKPLILSIAGFSVEEYVVMSLRAQEFGAKIIELNFGCPNIWSSDGAQKPIASYRPRIINDVLYQLERELKPAVQVLVKVSYIGDQVLLNDVAAVIGSYSKSIDVVKAVTVMNTLPNAFAFNEKRKPAITNKLAGLSGAAIKQLALGQVLQYREQLPENVAIIGCGGVASGQDVCDFLDVGASAVQVASALFQEGPNVFSRILQEYTDIVGPKE